MNVGRARSAAPQPAGEQAPLRETRDQAIRALSGAGLSSREISALRLCDVQCFANGKVSLRLRGPRWHGRSRYALLEGRPANQVARHMAARSGGELSQPVFAGRVAGAPLTHRAVLLVLRDPIERRERQ